jgi:hypothetical protein
MRGLTRSRRAASRLPRTRRPIPAGQVDDSAGDDAGGLDEQVAGGVQGDGEAGAVRVDAAFGLNRVSDGDPQDLVAGQQGVDLLGDPGRGPGTQYPAAQDRSSGRQAVR